MQTIQTAYIKAKRKYLEPRLTITEWVEKNLPDWYIDGSNPAKTNNLTGESNLETSPISAIIVPASLKDVDTKITYLEELKVLASKSNNINDFKAKIKAKYPEYSGLNYLDMTARFFFPQN